MPEAPCKHVWAPTALSYFTGSTSFVLLLFTIAGNLLVCIAVYKDPYKRLRTPFMFILVNLAITDLTVGCITLPISVATHFLEAIKEKRSEHVVISRMAYFISCTASILNLTAFCVDRCIAVNWPIKYRRLLSSKVCLAVSVSIWILAVIVASLYFVAGFINYLFIFAHVAFLLAVLICTITYQLLRKLNKHSKNRRAITNSSSRVSHKADRRVTKLFLAILLMFFLCYTPAIIMMYILKFCPGCDCVYRHILRDLQFLFIVSNSAVNPFVCTIRLKPFRQALNNIFHLTKSHGNELRQSQERRGSGNFMGMSFLQSNTRNEESKPLNNKDECTQENDVQEECKKSNEN